MKDYEHVVIWLDYFNKTLPRNKGRRLSKEKCVFDPSLKELIDATKAAGLEPTETEEQVRFPKRPYVRSGYIILEKKSTKTNIMNKIADKKYFPLIDKIFSFSEIVDAHSRIENRENIGKVIIDFNNL